MRSHREHFGDDPFRGQPFEDRRGEIKWVAVEGWKYGEFWQNDFWHNDWMTGKSFAANQRLFLPISRTENSPCPEKFPGD
jgi:hypothetical protein